MSVPAAADGRRNSQRSSVLIAATATAGQNRWPAKIRNLSSTGCMIETDAAIDAGSEIAISRGSSLQVNATVRWRRGNQCGVRFDSPIDVLSWHAIPTRSAIVGQTPVATQEKPIGYESYEHQEDLLPRIVEEVLFVARAIGAVSESLLYDPILRQRHSNNLQQLALSEQMLMELSAILKRNSSLQAADEIATGPMRGRLLRGNSVKRAA